MKQKTMRIYNDQFNPIFMIKKFALVAFFMLCFQIQAQNERQTNHYNYLIEEVLGDLNKDGLPDKVLISQDTLSEKAPYQLQIFFNNKGSFKQPFVTTTKFIQPKFPYGRDDYRSFSSLGTVEIKKGLLVISFELIRGTFNYKFRFQNGDFELIGYTEVTADNGQIYFNDFNLSTGIRLRRTEALGNNKVLQRKKEKLLIRPLPKLQDLIAYENDDYLR